MKNFLLFLALSSLTLATQAQTTAPFSNTYASYSQMWNIANVYRNAPYLTRYATSVSTNLGTQKDTTSGTIYLYTSTLGKGKVNADTFIVAPIDGYYNISFLTSCLKASATSSLNPVCTITIQGSFDGINWANIPGVAVATLTPTSLTVPVTQKWEIPVVSTSAAFSRYWRGKFAVATDTAVVQLFDYVVRPYTFSNN